GRGDIEGSLVAGHSRCLVKGCSGYYVPKLAIPVQFHTHLVRLLTAAERGYKHPTIVGERFLSGSGVEG
ncbi:hypothetical protein RUND412_011664, partial [Rhizina undulata]